MDNQERGRAIRARRLGYGIKSVHQFHKATGASREAITAAEDGTASAATYERLEAWLDNFEDETEDDAEGAPESKFIEVRLEGLYGVKSAIVKGPVEDRAALAELIELLMRGSQQDEQGDA